MFQDGWGWGRLVVLLRACSSEWGGLVVLGWCRRVGAGYAGAGVVERFWRVGAVWVC